MKSFSRMITFYLGPVLIGIGTDSWAVGIGCFLSMCSLGGLLKEELLADIKNLQAGLLEEFIRRKS
jgi:hypothetical protein